MASRHLNSKRALKGGGGAAVAACRLVPSPALSRHTPAARLLRHRPHCHSQRAPRTRRAWCFVRPRILLRKAQEQCPEEGERAQGRPVRTHATNRASPSRRGFARQWRAGGAQGLSRYHKCWCRRCPPPVLAWPRSCSASVWRKCGMQGRAGGVRPTSCPTSRRPRHMERARSPRRPRPLALSVVVKRQGPRAALWKDHAQPRMRPVGTGPPPQPGA